MARSHSQVGSVVLLVWLSAATSGDTTGDRCALLLSDSLLFQVLSSAQGSQEAVGDTHTAVPSGFVAAARAFENGDDSTLIAMAATFLDHQDDRPGSRNEDCSLPSLRVKYAYLLAHVSVRCGDQTHLRRAAATFARCESTTALRRMPSLFLAWDHYLAKDYLLAETEFKTLRAASPAAQFSDVALYIIANCRLGRENYRGAAEAYDTLLMQYPTFTDGCIARSYRAYCWRRLGQSRKAKDGFRQIARDSKCSKETKKFATEQLDDIQCGCN